MKKSTVIRIELVNRNNFILYKVFNGVSLYPFVFDDKSRAEKYISSLFVKFKNS